MTPPAKQTKITLVGAFPPPLGGVSVYIQRLSEALNSTHSVRVIDFYSQPQQGDPPYVLRLGSNKAVALLKACETLRKTRGDIVHFHVSAFSNFLYAAPLLLLASKTHRKKILTIHSGDFPNQVRKFAKAQRSLASSILNSFDHIIVVSKELRECLHTNLKVDREVRVLPAYLPPPTPKPSEHITSLIKESITNNTPIFVASGYGVRLYGYDYIMRSLSGLEFGEVELYLCTYGSYDESYMEELKRIPHGFKKIHLLKNTPPEDFAYVLKNATAFIRSTQQDGDSIALREAIYFEVPSFASNCVIRPAEAILFDLGKISSLREAVLGFFQTNSSSWGTKKPMEYPAKTPQEILSQTYD